MMPAVLTRPVRTLVHAHTAKRFLASLRNKANPCNPVQNDLVEHLRSMAPQHGGFF